MDGASTFTSYRSASQELFSRGRAPATNGRRVLKVKCFRLEFSSRMRISHRTFDLVCSHPLTLLHLLLIKSGNELYLSNDLTNMMSKRFYKAGSSLPSFLHFLPVFLSLTLHVCARCAPSFPHTHLV